ncbi:hypothetical protein BXZ70DRAFT_238379 [Cristinia sonorae]|uniref:Uncharacterized protein n=1 Tax=Cristinia sonorae TaxID=1940300 RepID=A0A8K0UMS9_9AGAR|nr:hypothetical protein BXZ70DRAFT_238379 [Cristinia sonorae]
MSTQSQSFSLVAAPSTDIWRNPPTRDLNNVPTQSLTSRFPLSTFLSARITFSGTWTHQFDQGGLLLVLSPKHDYQAAGDNAQEDKEAEAVKGKSKREKTRWLKTGVEFFEGKRNIGTVGTDTWSDWSLYPVSPSSAEEVTVEVRRESGVNGQSLWVYWLGGEGEEGEREREKKVAVREVAWVFAEEEEWEVGVEAYAARPAGVEGVEGGLEVRFWGAGVERL